MPRFKGNLDSPRRAPRVVEGLPFQPRLPPRCPPLPPVTPANVAKGLHTYYLSCDVRGLARYLPLAVAHHQRGFRAAFVGPAGIQFEAPSVTVVGEQEGNWIDHATKWAQMTPILEIHAQRVAKRQSVTLKQQEKAQEAFAVAQATVEACAEEMKAAEAELERVTTELIELQGVDSICIDGTYWDATYSREHVYLKRRDSRLVPEEEPAPPKARTRKKAAQRSRKAAA